MTRMRTTIPIQNKILRLKSLKPNKTKVAKLLEINRETVIKYWDGTMRIKNCRKQQRKFSTTSSRASRFFLPIRLSVNIYEVISLRSFPCRPLFLNMTLPF